MIAYVYHTDDRFPGMQWRYERVVSPGPGPGYAPMKTVRNVGEVRLDGGPWLTATTTLADHIDDRVNKAVRR